MKKKLLYTAMIMVLAGAAAEAASLCSSICQCTTVQDKTSCPVTNPGECCIAGKTTKTAKINLPCGTPKNSWWDPTGYTTCNDWCAEQP